MCRSVWDSLLLLPPNMVLPVFPSYQGWWDFSSAPTRVAKQSMTYTTLSFKRWFMDNLGKPTLIQYSPKFPNDNNLVATPAGNPQIIAWDDWIRLSKDTDREFIFSAGASWILVLGKAWEILTQGMTKLWVTFQLGVFSLAGKSEASFCSRSYFPGWSQKP